MLPFKARSSSESDRLSGREVNGLGCLLVEEFVKEADVGKRPSGHDGIVTSPGAVRVVLSRTQTVRHRQSETEARIVATREQRHERSSPEQTERAAEMTHPLSFR